MPKITYDSVILLFKQSKTNIKCPELIKSLKALGFDVVKGASGNHHTYSHPQLSDFFGGAFDCGHGRVPTVLPKYIELIRKTLLKYEDDLKEITNEAQK